MPKGQIKADNSKKQRKLLTQLGIAIVLIIIGSGNLFFGQHKYQEYRSLLSKAQAELASPQQQISLPILGPALNMDKQVQHISRLNSRIDFYNLVRIGGKGILALAGAVLLLCLVNAQQLKKSDSELG